MLERLACSQLRVVVDGVVVAVLQQRNHPPLLHGLHAQRALRSIVYACKKLTSVLVWQLHSGKVSNDEEQSVMHYGANTKRMHRRS